MDFLSNVVSFLMTHIAEVIQVIGVFAVVARWTALPAVMNAIVDALRPLGVTTLDMPATPERLWRAMRPGAR